MDNNKRLELIKILLNYTITKNKQDEDFMDYLNENLSAYNIDISPTVYIPCKEIIKILKINKDENEIEEEAEELNELFNKKNTNVDEVIEEFCKKYNV